MATAAAAAAAAAGLVAGVIALDQLGDIHTKAVIEAVNALPPPPTHF